MVLIYILISVVNIVVWTKLCLISEMFLVVQTLETVKFYIAFLIILVSFSYGVFLAFILHVGSIYKV